MNQNLPHWNYFRILEKDLEQCFRYVELKKSHFSVYSDEFGKIILVACSEIENALRSLALEIDPNAKFNNIGDYRNVLVKKYPNFGLLRIALPRYDQVVTPWECWVKDSSAPEWWKNCYNLIKHDRVGNPTAATLIRAINSVIKQVIKGSDSLIFEYQRV